MSSTTFSEQFYVTSHGQIGQYPGLYSPDQSGQYPSMQPGQYPHEHTGHLPSGSYPIEPNPDYNQQPPAYSAGGFTLNETNKSPV